MSAEHFLDSNVIVYLLDDTDRDKRSAATDLVRRGIRDGTACISFQVVQESLNVLTRKLGASPDQALMLMRDVLAPLWQVQPSVTLYRRGIELRARYRFSFYDSLIVSAALAAGCDTLYSEDLHHGQSIDGLTIRNPFARPDGSNIVHDR